ncbi:biotin/lipoyl-binding protein [Verrucomicrobium spinosum]|uniref:biotin/lipoyl-binding protein n=1 Tax=Verrucomicrobium spinosum TaxID=2736 RepID=UPI00094659ED
MAATGILEALSENVAIGVPVAGLVTEVPVKVNQSVKAGALLFKIDDRDLQAQKVRQDAPWRWPVQGGGAKGHTCQGPGSAGSSEVRAGLAGAQRG